MSCEAITFWCAIPAIANCRDDDWIGKPWFQACHYGISGY